MRDLIVFFTLIIGLLITLSFFLSFFPSSYDLYTYMQKHQKKGEVERKMSSLSMVEAKLPPGFRFHPRDDELICDYLMNKFASCESFLLIEVDLNKTEPWEIPETACIGGKEWYFYSQRDRKYATGLRTNRATVSGYWKATGKDRPVVRNGSLVGMRKTLVFYQGRAPKGKKTDWVMHEFRLEGPLGPPKLPPSKEDWVLCRVFHKTRDELGKPTVAQTTSTGSYDMEPSPSSLPALMDSYITFDQTPQIVDAPRDDEDDDNTNIGNNVYEQVPCFSIFNPNQTNPPSTLSQLFNMEQTNIVTPKNMININPMPLYHTTPFGSYLQAGVIPTTAATATISRNYHSDNGMNRLSSGDDKVIKAVLNHLTKMEATPASNMKGSSSISHGEAASSESYLSDVGLPTMWSNHY